MSQLIANLPAHKVWVRREHLRDFQDGHGEYTLGFWVSVKSIPGRALYFETYLPEYGAMYDKLCIDAFVSWDVRHPHTGPENPPSPDLPLECLQFWNSFDNGIVCIEKNLISNMEFEVRPRLGGSLKGRYLFTLDNYHARRDEPDYYFSEVPEEHKSHNIIELENGQIGAYPNNRCRLVDPSLTFSEMKTPDFKVSTRWPDVEHCPDWGRLGDQDDYFWTTPEEREEREDKEHVRWKEIQENPWENTGGQL